MKVFSSLIFVFGSNVYKVYRDRICVHTCIYTILAGDHWWPQTSCGHLRLAHAITHVLHRNFAIL